MNEYNMNAAPEVSEFLDEGAQQAPQSGFQKLFNEHKNKLIIAAGAIVAIVALILVLSFLGNTYKTPVKLMEKQANNKKFSAMFDSSTAVLNGFLEKEVNGVLKIMKKSDSYEDMMEDQKDYFEDHLEDMEDEYGKNFKYTYKIVDKDELEKDDLRDFRDNLRSLADEIEWLEDEVDDFDSDDWEDMADELEISKGDAKDLVNEILDIGKVCKKAKVTAGYELTVEILLDGSELDEPEESEMTVYVYKVDGRWIAYEGLNALESFAYFY